MDAPAEIVFGQLLASSIGFMLLAAAALVVFLVTYQKRLLRQQLRLRTAEADYQHLLLAAVVEAQERERERIGRDLHDGIGSTIATAKLLATRLATAPAADAASLLGTVQEILAAAVHDVRSISHSLYPAVLAHFGLAEALKYLVEISNEARTLAIKLEIDYSHSLVLTQELALYRICQELIHNALKHAQGATQLLVRLRQHSGGLTLTVQDDGCGFSLAASSAGQPAASGAGLRSMAVRVQLLQGHLHRQSAPGQGTCTTIELAAPVVHFQSIA